MSCTTDINSLIRVGMRLFTKDGRIVGNAQVTRVGNPVAISKYWRGAPPVYTITTDSGDTTNLTEAEIASVFHLTREG